MAIYGFERRLAFCRPSSTGNYGIGIDEQNKWICGLDGDRGLHEDVTFYKGNFYAVNTWGDVLVVKGLDGSSPPFVERIIKAKNEFSLVKYLAEAEKSSSIMKAKYNHRNMSYLVESSSSSSGGDLLKVIRRLEADEDYYRTVRFRVLKVDFDGPICEEEVTDLGEDCALFIGYNRYFSFSASKFPGCRGNCIYFTDNFFNRLDLRSTYVGLDMGVYNLEDGSFEKLYETSSQFIIPPPTWYVPN